VSLLPSASWPLSTADAAPDAHTQAPPAALARRPPVALVGKGRHSLRFLVPEGSSEWSVMYSLSRLGAGGEASLQLCTSGGSFRRSVAFQWFLTLFSVRPAMVLAMSAQRLPSCLLRSPCCTPQENLGECAIAAETLLAADSIRQ
jgi:hypothetical protein